jgi:hypothetical protein
MEKEFIHDIEQRAQGLLKDLTTKLKDDVNYLEGTRDENIINYRNYRNITDIEGQFEWYKKEYEQRSMKTFQQKFIEEVEKAVRRMHENLLKQNEINRKFKGFINPDDSISIGTQMGLGKRKPKPAVARKPKPAVARKPKPAVARKPKPAVARKPKPAVARN